MASKNRSRRTVVLTTESFEAQYNALTRAEQQIAWRAILWIRKNPRPNAITRREAPAGYGKETYLYLFSNYVFSAGLKIGERRKKGRRIQTTKIYVLAMKKLPIARP